MGYSGVNGNFSTNDYTIIKVNKILPPLPWRRPGSEMFPVPNNCFVHSSVGNEEDTTTYGNSMP